MLEQLAALLRERNHSGDAELAAGYEREAAALAKAVLSLYVEGQGFFSALYPNGTKIGVRCGKKRPSSFWLQCRFSFERRRPLAQKARDERKYERSKREESSDFLVLPRRHVIDFVYVSEFLDRHLSATMKAVSGRENSAVSGCDFWMPSLIKTR